MSLPDRSIRVSQDVWQRAKVAAAVSGESLSGYTEGAIEARLRGVQRVDGKALTTGSRRVEAVEWPSTEAIADEVSRHPRATEFSERHPTVSEPTPAFEYPYPEKKPELF